jgi:mannose-6-phosphate isomerase
LFLKPTFHERIWGGTQLREQFGYDIPYAHTGECWAVSAHPNGESVVINGAYTGLKLSELWVTHPELFHSKSKQFPILTKILDSAQDLSVQVHPDDGYAEQNKLGELGKSECWYIIDAIPDAQIILGHTAQSKQQLTEMVHNGKWDELLIHVPVKAGDFFYVPSGTVHSIGKGIQILETQENSDTTYRFYDFDRLDANGKKRELHIARSIEVTTIPYHPLNTTYSVKTTQATQITTFISNQYFTVQKWVVTGPSQFTRPSKYTIFSVIHGTGHIRVNEDIFQLKKGDHFILPYGTEPYQLHGKLELIVSTE